MIVSGGDPLVAVAAPPRGADGDALGAIDHVKVVRFHTRVPVVAPERVTADLVAALTAGGKATWVAIHANHPRELTPDARAALARLADAGIPLVSQTVLLAGVNDDAGHARRADARLRRGRVKPYYLHHGDLAPGTGHFRTTHRRGPGADARRCAAASRASASRPMCSTFPAATARCRSARPICDGDAVEDWQGGRHAYPDAAYGDVNGARACDRRVGGESATFRCAAANIVRRHEGSYRAMITRRSLLVLATAAGLLALAPSAGAAERALRPGHLRRRGEGRQAGPDRGLGAVVHDLPGAEKALDR